MCRRSTNLLKTGLAALYYSGLDTLLSRLTRGDGVIFMMHHVSPEPAGSFEPNRILKVTPEFLDRTITQVKRAGFECVSLDEAYERLANPGSTNAPFACFTLDDGYKDNRVHAYPVFKRHNVPFTIYVPSEFPGGNGELWWLALERAIARSASVSVVMEGATRMFACATPAQKDSAYYRIYWWLRTIPETQARAVVRELAEQAGIDTAALCRDLVMSWDEIRALAADPLVTIGAHTRHHVALAPLAEAEAEIEMAESIRRIEIETGRPCRHFSYPYGDARSAGPREFAIARRLGIKTAVTTAKGTVGGRAGKCLTGLPRLSLNGDYQDERYVKVLLSGVPFAFWNWAHRLSARPA